MEVATTIKYVRISPRKLNRILKDFAGQSVEKIATNLKFMPLHGARVISSVLNSSIANAIHNYHLDKSNLFIKEAFSGQAAIMKRITPMSRGKAGRIQKKLSHVTIILKEGIK